MNIGIIGYGIMGQIRLREIEKIGGGLKVTKICEVDEAALSRIPDGITRVRDYKEITRDPSIEAVFVCPPNFLIKECVVDALIHDKHVFSEKPPGRNLQETKAMVAAEQESRNRKLMFGFNHRHHESALKAKELIDSGEFGKVLWMRGRYGKAVDENFFNNWRAKKDLAGGGIFLDQGIHMLDLFLMMAEDFDSTKAEVSNLFWNLEIEDNVFAIFKNSKTGVVASLHSTMTQWRHLFSLEIFLEKGHIVLNGLLTNSGSYGPEELSYAKNLRAPSVVKSTVEKVVFSENTSWANEMRLFFDAIRNDTPVTVGSSADAVKLMKIVESVYAEGAKQ